MFLRLSYIFLLLDKISRKLFPILFLKSYKKKCIKKSYDWVKERLNGEDGLGGIFPAMVNVYESLVVLGYPKDHPTRKMARQAIDNLLTERNNTIYCQPSLSPIWDTALVSQTLIETENNKPSIEVENALVFQQ